MPTTLSHDIRNEASIVSLNGGAGSAAALEEIADRVRDLEARYDAVVQERNTLQSHGAKLHVGLQRALAVPSHYTDDECLVEVRRLMQMIKDACGE